MSDEHRGTHRFSAWDGTQNPWDDETEHLLDDVGEEVFRGVDVESALRRLLGRGWRDSEGQMRAGLDEIIDRLRQERQRNLQHYDLGSMFRDIDERIDRILARERQTLDEHLRHGDPDAPDLARRIAQSRRSELDDLPASPGGAIQALRNYEFMDAEAGASFQRLLDEMQQAFASSYADALAQSLRTTTPEDVARTRAMLHDLNELVRRQSNGENPAQLQAAYDEFRNRHRDILAQTPDTLDEFLASMRNQMARMDSLMRSLSREQRRELEELAAASLGDRDLQEELAELLDALGMSDGGNGLGQRHSFFGHDPVTLEGAMRLMQRMQSMDELEQALREMYRGGSLGSRERDLAAQLLGDDAVRRLDGLDDITRKLEKRGLLERGPDGLTLSARGMRRIGQKALRDIFSHLVHDRLGDHPLSVRGGGSDHSEETRPHEFGDAFDIDVNATVMNAVRRRAEQGTTANTIDASDFVVHQTTATTRTATVLLLDMSRSMPLRGYFYAAKKVALALDSLIRSQYPRDTLHVVGFSDYARQIAPDALARLSVNEYVYGTNLQHGLMTARRLLARERGANRQIIIVSDGEPTAHMEGDVAVFFYPPLAETFDKTLLEVRNCTRDNITINTFMLESNRHLVKFVDTMTRINRGRAFFISPDRLGDYVLVDFVASRGPGPRAA